MARVIEVHGFGHFVVTLKEGDPNPVQLSPAPADLVALEQQWGNVQVMIPHHGAMYEQATFKRCPVEVGGVGESARVAGIEAPMPQGVAQRAVLALVGAFPGGLSRQALNIAASAGDARNALRDLVENYPLWRAALRFPREKGDYRKQTLGYRIVAYPDVIASMIDLAASGVLSDDDVKAAIENSDSFRELRDAG